MKQLFILAAGSFVSYGLLAYAVPRTVFGAFIGLYSLLFVAYAYLLYQAKKQFKEQDWRWYVGAAIAFRLVFVFATPALSDDFWRYLWDGRLLSMGLNPYRYLPAELVNSVWYQEGALDQLYTELNSPNYYTVYPPFIQLLFASTAWLFPKNVLGAVISLRLMTIAAELGTLLAIKGILHRLKYPLWLLLIYAFNPLVIIELSGNLHTEAWMIFFLALALYALLLGALHWSAFSFALAVGAKLLPLLFLPLILRRLWFKKGVVYCCIVGILNILLFACFLDIALLQKIRTGVQLYFAHFEFNASVYYFLRYWLINEYWQIWEYHDYFRGFWPLEGFLHYDLYVILRKTLPFIDVLLILWFSWHPRAHRTTAYFMLSFLVVYSVHFFMATTVHPWYIAPLVLLSTWTAYRYILLWTWWMGFTYISYQGVEFGEHTWVILLEYLSVFACLIWELRRDQKKDLTNKI